VGGRQLKQPGTPHVCQHGAGNVLSVVVHRHGSCGWPIRSCTLMDPLSAQAIHRLGSFQDCVVMMFFVTLVDTFQILIAFYFDMQI
jgi:hypothetical protein